MDKVETGVQVTCPNCKRELDHIVARSETVLAWNEGLYADEDNFPPENELVCPYCETSLSTGKWTTEGLLFEKE